MDMGDHVIIVNADKVVLTSARPRGSSCTVTAATRRSPERDLRREMARRPEQAVMDTIRGMIPKTRLGRAQISKLKVYAESPPCGAEPPAA